MQFTLFWESKSAIQNQAAMNLSMLDDVLWATTFIGHVALFFVMFYRERWRQFPIFTLWVGFNVTLTIALYLIFRHGAQLWYTRVYWSSTFLDFLLQLSVVFEIARVVLRPTGTWVRDASRSFLLWSIMGLGVAALLAWTVSPSGLRSAEVWEVRSSLFTSLVTCELVLVMFASAKRLGLGWRNHVMALGEGLAVWATVAVGVDGLESYFGSTRMFSRLDHLRIFVYLGALVFWVVRFWAAEPVRNPISGEMEAYLVALHKRVRYDLATLDVENKL
jgi:hypothetical protein